MRRLVLMFVFVVLAAAALPTAAAGASSQPWPGTASPARPPIRELRLGWSLGGSDRIALVGRREDDPLAPFRSAGLPLGFAVERTAGVEWLHAGELQLSAGYASSRPPRSLRLDAAVPELSGYDIRSAKGLRLAGELIDESRILPVGLSLEGRLERIRIEDNALVGAGTHIPEARIALVLKRAW